MTITDKAVLDIAKRSGVEMVLPQGCVILKYDDLKKLMEVSFELGILSTKPKPLDRLVGDDNV